MIRQVVAFVENQKGVIRRVVTLLREEGIRICGLSTVDSPEFGIVRMVVDAPDAASASLSKAGFVVKECEVIAVEMKSPDEMESLLEVIQDGNVNINYFYSSFGSSGERPVLVLHTDDMDEAEAMLNSHGFCCMSSRA
ncbi:MAG: amino acid-binding protein [Clostridiales bacterium]|nr:amino acid-binding protein [Clostridiales bacterium]